VNSTLKIIDLLDAVRQTAPAKWRARCPAHGGKSASLAIADVDGRVLVKCFAGCATGDVLASLGLKFSDLFPQRLGEHKPMKRSPWPARDVLDLATREATVVAIVASDVLEGRSVSAADWARLAQATARLTSIGNGVCS